MGLHNIGVANVLSIISGTLFLCAIPANFSISSTVNAGFARVSPNTAFVLGLKAFCMVLSSASASTKMHSMPSFLSDTANRFTVPP
jgi:hypothetical protein